MWKAQHGYGIATHSFIANGDHQMTIIYGDNLEIFEYSGNWARGKNYRSGCVGIFPKACIDFSELATVTSESFSMSKKNIVYIESQLTIKHSLKKFFELSPKECLDTFDSIESITNALGAYDSIPEGDSLKFSAAHTTLGTRLCNLRSCLNVPSVNRHADSSIVTLSSYGLEQFMSNKKSLQKGNKIKSEYNILHVNIDVRQLQHPLLFRIALYSPNRLPWYSNTASVILTPGFTKDDLVFDQIDIDNNPSIYLVIYADDSRTSADSGGSNLRKCIGCAIVKLQAFASNYGNMVSFSANMMTSSSDIISNLHNYLINDCPPEISKTIEGSQISFDIRATCFKGQSDSVIFGQNLNKFRKVMPFTIPSVLPYNFERSSLGVFISSINQDTARSKAKLLVRLFDSVNKKFLPRLQEIGTNEFRSPAWCSVLLKGSKDIEMNEAFSINLMDLETDITKLYLLFEFQRSNLMSSTTVTQGISLIPLSDQIGCIPQQAQGSVDLFAFTINGNHIDATTIQFPIQGKKIGSITYSLHYTSTKYSNNSSLIKVLKWEEYQSELIECLHNIKFIGIKEWSKFFRPLMISLISLIVGDDEQVSQNAFISLRSLFGELLSKGGLDHVHLFDEFIVNEFVKEEGAPKLIFLSKLHLKLLPKVFAELRSDESTKEYRDFLKTLPYYMQLICRSFVLDRDSSSVPDFKAQLKEFFDCLNNIIKEPPSKDRIFVHMNQCLIFEHFPSLIDALHMCLLPIDVIPYIESFLFNSSNSNKKNNIDLLIALTSKPCWIDPKARVNMKMLYTQEIDEYLKNSDLEPQIINLLGSMFLTTKDRFILKYFPIIIKYLSNKSPEISDLVSSVLFAFPQDIQYELFLQIVQSNQIQYQQLLFIFLYYLTMNFDTLAKMMKDVSISFDVKLLLFKECFKTAFYAYSSSEIVLDFEIRKALYSINNNFMILVKLHRSMPLNHQYMPSLFLDILRTYLLIPSQTLQLLLFSILNSDIEKSKTVKESFRNIILVLQELLSYPDFMSILPVFEFRPELCTEFSKSSQQIQDFCRDSSGLVLSLYDIKSRPFDRVNESELSESLLKIIGYCKKFSLTSLHLEFISKLLNLHEICNNIIEQVYCLDLVLDITPCDNKLVQGKDRFAETTGRKRTIEILFKILSIALNSEQFQYGLPFIDRIKEQCVEKFKHIELLPQIYQIESQIYKQLGNTDVLPPKYYRCSFNGAFDQFFQNKSFVYRRDSHYTKADMSNELKQKFPDAVMDSNKNQKEMADSKTERFINILPIYPCSEEEKTNIFSYPDFRKPIIGSKNVQFVSIFRQDSKIEQNGVTKNQQIFLQTQQAFPLTITRSEIAGINTLVRTLSTLESLILQVNKDTLKIDKEVYLIELLMKKKEKPSEPGKFLMVIKSVMVSFDQIVTKQIVTTYAKPEYIQAHPDEKKQLVELKKAVDRQVSVLQNALDMARKFVTADFSTLMKDVSDSFELIKIAFSEAKNIIPG